MRRNFDYIIIRLNKYEKFKQIRVSYRILFILFKLMKTTFNHVCISILIYLTYPNINLNLSCLNNLKLSVV